MRKSVLAIVAMTTLTISMASTLQGTVSEATVKFTGEITGAPCNLNMEGGSAIDLGSYSVRYFEENANRATPSQIGNLQFTDCQLTTSDDDKSPITAVDVQFVAGTGTAGNTDLWNVRGGAEGVGVQVKVGTEVIPSTGKNVEKQLVTGTNNIEIEGSIVGLGDYEKIKPGKVNLAITVQATYK